VGGRVITRARAVAALALCAAVSVGASAQGADAVRPGALAVTAAVTASATSGVDPVTGLPAAAVPQAGGYRAAVFGFGGASGTVTDGVRAAQRHLAEAARMQQRSTDGRMYAAAAEYTYVGREEHTAQLASQLVLTLTLAGDGIGTDAVAPAGVDVPAEDALRTPPAPADESRLIDPAAAR
jgi:hypothetical protein